MLPDLDHLRGGGAAGAAATARKRQERQRQNSLLQGLQDLLQNFQTEQPEPVQERPRTPKKRKKEPMNLLTGLKRLVKAATEGKIPWRQQHMTSLPKRLLSVPKQMPKMTEADNNSRRCQKVNGLTSLPKRLNVHNSLVLPMSINPLSTWADIAKSGNAPPKRALNKRPTFQLWKPPDDPERVGSFQKVRRTLEEGQCPKCALVLATYDQYEELKLLCCKPMS